MLDAVSLFSDELTEAILAEEPISEDMVREAIRKGTLALKLTPVLMGSAYKNKGVQPLLDAVVHYLPSPLDIENDALDLDQEEERVVLASVSDLPLVMLAFKFEVSRYGQLTYVRIYQGTLNKGDTIVNMRTGKRVKAGRLVRMHAEEMEEIEFGDGRRYRGPFRDRLRLRGYLHGRECALRNDIDARPGSCYFACSKAQG